MKKRTNEKVMSDISSSEPFRLVWWLYFAIPYAMMAFMATTWLNTPRWFPIAIVLAIIAATAQLVAVWSVYSPGSYLSRIVCASMLASIVIAGAVLGANPIASRMPKEAVHAARAFALLFPLFCCVSQIPHWILRIGFGWQFVWNDGKPAPSFKLRELFSITLVFALALAGVRVAASHYIEIFPAEVFAESALPQQSSAALTPEEQRAAMEKVMALGMLIYPVFLSILSVVFLPFLFLVFQSKNASRAVFYCGITAMCGLLLANVTNAIATGGMAGLTGGFGMLIGSIALSVAAFLLPLLYARTAGFSFVRNQNSQPNQGSQ